MNKAEIQPSASKIKIVGILTYSFFVTLKYSLKTIYYGVFLSRNNRDKMRQKIDTLLVDWSSRIIKSIKLDLNVTGDLKSQLADDRAVIFMCNHASAYDVPLAFYAIPESIRMIAKSELFKIPIFSQALRVAEFPSINRQNRGQAIKDLQFARNKMKSGIRIWMFPEGTRSIDGQLRPLKKGGIRLAIDTNAIIIPIVMQDIEHILPTKLWLKMRLGQRVNIRIGEAIDCRNFDMEGRHQVSELVYNQMQQLLQIRP